MIVILILISLLEVAFSFSCCKLDTDDGTIDISALSEMEYSVDIPTSQFSKGHIGKFTVCKDMDASTCSNEKTIGPSPFVEWDESRKFCAWDGSLEGCEIGSYKSEEKTFEIFYPGKLTSEIPVAMIRNVHLTLVCDKDEAGTPVSSCEKVETHGNPVSTITIYCTITSSIACPKTSIITKWTIIGTSLGVGLFLMLLCIIYGVGVCIAGGLVLFFVTCGSSTFGMCCLLRAGYRQLADDEEFGEDFNMTEFDGDGEGEKIEDMSDHEDGGPEDNVTINRDNELENVEEAGDVDL